MFEALRNLDIPQPVLAAAAASGIMLLVVVVATRIARRFRRRRRQEPPPNDLAIDVAGLSTAGPSSHGPRLELYNLPVRLAVLVIAPTGRGGTLPDDERLLELVDQVAPGMDRVVKSHRPLVHRWPAQLSAGGFANTFFAAAPLPGRAGKGTPWTALAGRCEWEEKNFQLGMLLCAASPNSLGQIVVKHETAWLDLLRVRQ